MQVHNSDNFKFFVPIDISKAKNLETGKEEMKISGIASARGLDADGEDLDPNGFDLSYFKNQGFFNWNHQGSINPLAIIGEPTKATITKEGLYVEGFLYADNDMAQKAYKAAKMLQENSPTRRMGFSIEGQATKRDPKDPNKILMAKITSCAITPSPKCAKTFVNIIKGEYDPADFEKEDEYDEQGKKILKDMEAGSITGNEGVNVGTSGSALKEESVGKRPKNLSKAEVYQKIFETYRGIDVFKAETIFNFINKKIMTTDKEISEDNLEKALKLLEKAEDIIAKGGKSTKKALKEEDTDDKGESEGEEDSEDEMRKSKEDLAEMKKAKRLTKALMDDDFSKAKIISEVIKKGYSKDMAEDCYKAIVEEDSADKGESEGEEDDHNVKKALKKKKEDKKPDFLDKGKKVSKKDEEDEEDEDAEEDEKSDKMEKGFKAMANLFNSKNKNLGIILKGIHELVAEQKETINDLVVENSELRKSFEDIKDELNTNSTPVRKSVSTVGAIEKSFGANGGSAGKSNGNVLSLTRDKKRIMDVIERKTFMSKGVIDNDFATALRIVEANGTPSQEVISRLRVEEGITLTN